MPEESNSVIRGVSVKLEIGKRSVKRSAFNRLQSHIGEVTGSNGAVLFDMYTEVDYSKSADDVDQYMVKNCSDDTVGLLITLNPVNRTYFLPIELEEIDKLDKLMSKRLNDGTSVFIFNSSLRLTGDDKTLGIYNTNTTWPSKFITAQWVVIDPDS